MCVFFPYSLHNIKDLQDLQCTYNVTLSRVHVTNVAVEKKYVVGSKSFLPDIQKPRQMENGVRDI